MLAKITAAFLLMAVMVSISTETAQARSTNFLSSHALTVEEILSILPKRCKHCCYGGKWYRHNKVVRMFPQKCLILYCSVRRIIPYYFGGPDQCGCCVYNGVMYLSGQRIPGICIHITCNNGQWETTGQFNSNCKLCRLWNDPFFLTFDQQYYQFHGKCNYSIAQKNYGLAEDFGIYGQFNSCPWTSLQSCLEYTTLRDNTGTVIQIDHMTAGLPVTVNSVSATITTTIQTLPSARPSCNVLAWQWGNCYIFVGTQGLVLMTCRDHVFVWANAGLVNRVNGLCGHYNMYVWDDFTDRKGDVWALSITPFAFPNSWKTAVQPNRCPRGRGGRKHRAGVPADAEDPCNATQTELDSFQGACESLFSTVQWNGNMASSSSLQYAVDSCVATLCTMNQTGTSVEVVDEWKGRMQVMLEDTVEIEANTVDFNISESTTGTPYRTTTPTLAESTYILG